MKRHLLKVWRCAFVAMCAYATRSRSAPRRSMKLGMRCLVGSGIVERIARCRSRPPGARWCDHVVARRSRSHGFAAAVERALHDVMRARATAARPETAPSRSRAKPRRDEAAGFVGRAGRPPLPSCGPSPPRSIGALKEDERPAANVQPGSDSTDLNSALLRPGSGRRRARGASSSNSESAAASRAPRRALSARRSRRAARASAARGGPRPLALRVRGHQTATARAPGRDRGPRSAPCRDFVPDLPDGARTRVRVSVVRPTQAASPHTTPFGVHAVRPGRGLQPIRSSRRQTRW